MARLIGDVIIITVPQSIKLERADLVDAFDGIQFLPLDKNTYLRVQCFINLARKKQNKQNCRFSSLFFLSPPFFKWLGE